MLSLGSPSLLAAETSSAKAPPKSASFHIQGFRSAHFGMVEQAVREAIKKDFSLSGQAVKEYSDPTERTKSLIINVDNLLADDSQAAVAYLLGYQRSVLFRVNVVWGHGVSNKMTAEQVTGLANALRNYLVEQAYRPDSVILNQTQQDGTVIVFQGNDEKGRMTQLVLTPVVESEQTDKAKTPKIVGASLRLSYIENPQKPDIFRIESGF